MRFRSVAGSTHRRGLEINVAFLGIGHDVFHPFDILQAIVRLVVRPLEVHRHDQGEVADLGVWLELPGAIDFVQQREECRAYQADGLVLSFAIVMVCNIQSASYARMQSQEIRELRLTDEHLLVVQHPVDQTTQNSPHLLQIRVLLLKLFIELDKLHQKSVSHPTIKARRLHSHLPDSPAAPEAHTRTSHSRYTCRTYPDRSKSYDGSSRSG